MAEPERELDGLVGDRSASGRHAPLELRGVVGQVAGLATVHEVQPALGQPELLGAHRLDQRRQTALELQREMVAELGIERRTLRCHRPEQVEGRLLRRGHAKSSARGRWASPSASATAGWVTAPAWVFTPSALARR